MSLIKKCFNKCGKTFTIDDTTLGMSIKTPLINIMPNYKGIMICRNCHNNFSILKKARKAQATHDGFEFMKEMRPGF